MANEYIPIKFKKFETKIRKKTLCKILIGAILTVIVIFNINFECETEYFKFKYEHLDGPFSKNKENPA